MFCEYLSKMWWIATIVYFLSRYGRKVTFMWVYEFGRTNSIPNIYSGEPNMIIYEKFFNSVRFCESNPVSQARLNWTQF